MIARVAIAPPMLALVNGLPLGPITHFAAAAPPLHARARMGSLHFAFVTTNIREDSRGNPARDSRARVEGTTLATSGAARRPRLPHEPLLELGLDRGTGEVGVDV